MSKPLCIQIDLGVKAKLSEDTLTQILWAKVIEQSLPKTGVKLMWQRTMEELSGFTSHRPVLIPVFKMMY